MSFLHHNSCECTKSELDLFSLPPTQTSIESGQWVHYKPISSLSDDAPLEFVVPGHGDEYVDLSHTLLNITACITGVKEEEAAGLRGPVNLWLHSLFTQVDVFLNQKLVTPPSHAYPYRAYIETLLNYGPAAKLSHLTTALWYEDTPGKMDDCAQNHGAARRRVFTEGGKEVEMMGHLHCDLFNQEKFLPSGVEMRLKLVRSKSGFSIFGNRQFAEIKVKITDASLLVRKVKISPSVLLAHSRALEKATAKFPLTRVDIKTVTISKDVQSKTIDNIFLGQMPKRVIAGFVLNSAFNGDITKNPFNFQHFDLNFMCLYLDGNQIPSKPLQPEFAESGRFIQAYHTLFSGTGMHFQDIGNGISRDEYHGGFFLLAFDLTPDLDANGSHWSLQKNGSLRMEVRFKSPLKETVNCILFAEFNNILEIDRYRNVGVDYSS
ncbi:hypothetical protein J437_LFUL013124 [Ladona fulva]|uniref:Uncharacterized protein n=1 Tax=Ladona fulva TaxID=123851 RepID=A0A8K0KJU0_LADFU|nr:hypothetical protein J437_LFUL013124 [Ladona fulva]